MLYLRERPIYRDIHGKKPVKFTIDFAKVSAYRLETMFDDELPKPKTSEFPRNMTDMSVSELSDYIDELREEIGKAEADIAKKKASEEAAASVFK